MDYKLIDHGNGKKLEQFGTHRLIRPCGHAIWPVQHRGEWDTADAHFSREGKKGWEGNLPSSWHMDISGLKVKIAPTDFGHLGAFPEHINNWDWLQEIDLHGKRVLNLFAYSGIATLVAAKAGAKVCHLDSSSGMVQWARENAALNHLSDHPIRWIVDDAVKFVKREIKRESYYDGIILDPPSFGRGAKGEVFKIEEEIVPLLKDCKKLLTKDAQFVFFSCHTPHFSPTVMHHLLESSIGRKKDIESGEMLIRSEKARDLPLGCFARWKAK